MDRLKHALDDVHASKELKTRTAQAVISASRKHSRRSSTVPRTALAFSMMFVFLLIGSGAYAYYTPYSHVSVDVNPSLELSLNRWNRVIGYEAMNEDGQRVLDSVALMHMTCGDAVRTLMSESALSDFVSEDSDLTFTVVSPVEASLSEEIAIAANTCGGAYRVDCANEDTHDEAHSHGLSVGVYKAYLSLAEYDSTVTPEDCKTMTMHELNDAVTAHECEHHVEETVDTEVLQEQPVETPASDERIAGSTAQSCESTPESTVQPKSSTTVPSKENHDDGHHGKEHQ